MDVHMILKYTSSLGAEHTHMWHLKNVRCVAYLRRHGKLEITKEDGDYFYVLLDEIASFRMLGENYMEPIIKE